jgi:Mlc titration factor MtfA (ptsG expression regulator)
MGSRPASEERPLLVVDRVERGDWLEIDPYASTNPEEFFAVTSEYFFTAPALLNQYYPEVYRELADYYRLETLSWGLPLGENA